MTDNCFGLQPETVERIIRGKDVKLTVTADGTSAKQQALQKFYHWLIRYCENIPGVRVGNLKTRPKSLELEIEILENTLEPHESQAIAHRLQDVPLLIKVTDETTPQEQTK